MQLMILRNLQLGFKDVLMHKTRSLLTMLGVVFGVGSVIAMLAVGEGASQQAMEEIQKLGSQNIILTSIKPSEDENAGSSGGMMSMYGLLRADEQRIREGIPHVRRTVPIRQLPIDVMLGERNMDARVVGTSADWFDLVRRDILAGRVLNEHDQTARNAVCVLTEQGARRLLAGRHSIGEYVKFGGYAFQVVGIVRHEGGGGGSIQAPDQPTDAYIPLQVLLDRFGDITIRQTTGSRSFEMVELHQILVEVDSIDNVENVAAAIDSMLQRFHKREDYRASVPLALLRQAEATKRTFNIVLGSIAGISLLVGGIGIMNIMLASVTERTREIGVRRAIGARRRQIVGQFLIETMVLSCTGGVVGIALGLGIPKLITRFSGMNTLVPSYSLPLAFGISVAIGIVFGLYPAVRAANLDPIEALRHE